MTGSQVDLLNWYCKKMYGELTWNQVVQNFARDHLENAVALARQEAASALSNEDLLAHIAGNVESE